MLLRRYEDSVKTLKNLVEMNNTNQEFISALKEAESKLNEEISKKKHMFKKMIYAEKDQLVQD